MRTQTGRSVLSHLIVSLQPAPSAIQPPPPSPAPHNLDMPFGSASRSGLPLPKQREFLTLGLTGLSAPDFSGGRSYYLWLGLTTVKGGFPHAPGKQTHWLGTLSVLPYPTHFKTRPMNHHILLVSTLFILPSCLWTSPGTLGSLHFLPPGTFRCSWSMRTYCVPLLFTHSVSLYPWEARGGRL